MKKVYIEVIVKYSTDGLKLPIAVIWEDGRKFEIDKIIDIRKAASLKAGGQGLRYKVKINGKEKYLFLEEDRWFVEGY